MPGFSTIGTREGAPQSLLSSFITFIIQLQNMLTIGSSWSVTKEVCEIAHTQISKGMGLSPHHPEHLVRAVVAWEMGGSCGSGKLLTSGEGGGAQSREFQTRRHVSEGQKLQICAFPPGVSQHQEITKNQHTECQHITCSSTNLPNRTVCRNVHIAAFFTFKSSRRPIVPEGGWTVTDLFGVTKAAINGQNWSEICWPTKILGKRNRF